MPQVVLVNPQIPPNTGNIARTCAATRTPLHLVGPLGFEMSDRYLKRAGLDYWQYVNWTLHESIEKFRSQSRRQSGRWIGFSTRGHCNHTQFRFHADDWLLFGSETEGLSQETLAECEETVYIPMFEPGVRSLNLSVSAALGLFECLRQVGKLQQQ
ncbi:tRNA (cytidine(34)-2'-O)-methyltransferase [Phormidium yuhuli AB48]|uniref:Putative tRNA (cytidine(34)-2'-O)-methyltransferase n=1 Tax=Phormidium yuhuli AB48 TaxID=2940671 RepID=A0ABY5ASZ6_9CYAN|nr:tRNA (cytidine(34)-2'-O)-methyltransferase [Phormidium yuhuli]USR92323.1 tRNA (cytidine(34)-2'-O)-methyltransferase [Phormidium yuhuli AB48]